MQNITFNVFKKFFLLVIIICEFNHVLPAMDGFGQPTSPVPFFNNLNIGCCHQNAFFQCMFQCWQFCLFLDRVKKPKDDLIANLKTLRMNLLAFNCDSKNLTVFLSKFPSSPDELEFRKLIKGCSMEQCLGIRAFMNKSCIREIKEMNIPHVNYTFIYDYIFLRKIFGLNPLYYLDKAKSVFKMKKIRFSAEDQCFEYTYDETVSTHLPWLRSYGFDFVIFHVPSLDLFLVRRTFPSDAEPKIKLTARVLTNITSSLESFFTSMIGRTCSLRSVYFTATKTLNFIKKPDCSSYVWEVLFKNKGFWVDGKLSSFVESVEEIESESFVHCAAYVKCRNDWYFCDDFFRECLGRPLIRKIHGNVQNMFKDLLECEEGKFEVLFFCADA